MTTMAEKLKPKPPDPKPAEKLENPKEAEDKPKDAKPPAPAPFIYVPYYPQTYEAGRAYRTRQYYDGYGGGPYNHRGHGGPSPSYDDYAMGRPVYDSYGGYWWL